MSFTPSVQSLNIDKDASGGLPTGLRLVSTWIIQKILTANTATTITVPSGATRVVLAADCNIFVNCNGAASIATVTTGAGSELNPAGYFFNATSPAPATISVISASNGNISAAFYSN